MFPLPQEVLHRRIASRPSGLIDIRSDLLHFALITYALPAERLRPYIPSRFDVPTFPINGQHLALMSAVPFLDDDFHYYRIAPFLMWKFAQTNYRVYVMDREMGEPMALTPGFATLDEQILILTHPVAGYFYMLTDKRRLSLSKPKRGLPVGTYSVWHEEIPLTVGKAKHLYFSLYEQLGLLSWEEMQKPHSVLICPKIMFEVHLPPHRAT